MEDVTRKRIMRKLEELPEAQLYQVLDYIEFLELKHARTESRQPDAFQRFAERLEDQMRVRSLAPKAMKGTMKVMSTAGKVLDEVRSFGKDLVAPPDGTRVTVRDPGPRTTAAGPEEDGSTGGDEGGENGGQPGSEPSRGAGP